MDLLLVVGIFGIILWAIAGIAYLGKRDFLTFHGFIADLLSNLREL